jgi:hypothetical protein
MVKIAAGIQVLTTLGALVVAGVLASRGASESLVSVAPATSTALAWGGGILLAVPASLGAFVGDRASGIRSLLRVHGASPGAYARGRVLGLALVLFLTVGSGTLIAGGAAALLASSASHQGVGPRAAQALVAALVHALAFAAVVAPLSLASLGAHARGGGYARFLALLIVPELLEPWTSHLVPVGWGALLSVPSALSALRSSLLPPGIDAAMLGRSVFVLTVFAATCLAIVGAEIRRIDDAEVEGGA